MKDLTKKVGIRKLLKVIPPVIALYGLVSCITPQMDEVKEIPSFFYPTTDEIRQTQDYGKNFTLMLDPNETKMYWKSMDENPDDSLKCNVGDKFNKIDIYLSTFTDPLKCFELKLEYDPSLISPGKKFYVGTDWKYIADAFLQKEKGVIQIKSGKSSEEYDQFRNIHVFRFVFETPKKGGSVIEVTAKINNSRFFKKDSIAVLTE